ncbi:bacterial NAD-glutamate dehydrogenase family protein [Neorickettsia helminthoeca str. Oregon]|uniref:Bacterial NAD-glutamate dehydrogenase family protein n=1 Tax=Neorickettsia helminthoeca str. Oregon TaxID=1286528 RepID=X5H4E0_9RICK|nr:NAD-glutamate dehydrogenase domain-containing protein [Neorickettsia helminthoeca]AHX11431.1 bacterial NAD-glutamate dehydrogenase family protein [Neorickettsia helminthoeca str. Oregon]
MHRKKYSQFIAAVLSKSGDVPSESFISLVNQFYITLREEDYSDPDYFFKIAKEVYELLENRIEGRRKIKIFNSKKEYKGSKGKYVVVQILNPDMPFLVDSFTEEIKANGFTIYKRLNVVLPIERDENGNLIKIHSRRDPGEGKNESLLYFLIDETDQNRISILRSKLEEVSNLVVAVVSDWKKMVTVLESEISKIKSCDLSNQTCLLEQKNHNCLSASEIIAFLEWLNEHNFIFLGYEEYSLDKEKLEKKSSSLLGICRLERNLGNSNQFKEYTALLYVGRSGYVSRVHRRVNVDCIRIKCLSDKGEVIGEKRFLGLFTSTVYYQDVRLIPILRKKIENVEKMASFVKGGHNHKALLAIIQGLPRGELFHTSSEELYETCTGMISLAIKPTLRLFIRRDKVGMFIYCVVFVPNEQFSMKLRYKMRKFIAQILNGTVSDEYLIIGESGLVRLQLVLKVDSFEASSSDEEIEKILISMARDWDEELTDVICKESKAKDNKNGYLEYVGKFPESYKESFDALSGYRDIRKILKVTTENPLSVKLYEESSKYHLKIYFVEGTLELHHLIPVIENMSMKVMEHNCYKVKCSPTVMIHHFCLQSVAEMLFSVDKIREKFEGALTRIVKNELENDQYNALIVLAGLDWREILLLRMFGSYLKQISFKYNPSYIQAALSHHPDAAVLIIRLFHARFSPDIKEESRQEKVEILKGKSKKILSSVTNVMYDNIIRTCIELCLSILRTNYYMNKEYISVKISSKDITDMPLPKPFVEVFVYHNKFEAIHLRGGKIARGGIRWSDRLQDFRTEILGLMKAQMAKNTAIIPVGSKGGFILKEQIEDRQLLTETAIRYYKDFLRGILDLTDNIVNGKCEKAKDILTYDRDDSYLVVAADKGTAKFSNYANEVSAEYNFWLGDAFASGGSSGYDHKKLGITARGAWISMQMAFWERFNDLERKGSSIIGIGDMSGDVFGNGMLLSNKIKLVAAFNHMHIFIDPNPDPEISFQERQRMFNLPSSTWMDYNHSLISKGGGVFLRNEKLIPISSEMKKVFDIYEEKLTPNELIKYILQSDVDVIWNGGIGTYVKSSEETNEVVGDKANDSIRVDGKNVRAKVIVEGGNLGCTQLGRIEYSGNGGIVNTDFIDNCAGVSCSDIEVNIKIAFSKAIKSGKITLRERDILLKAMEPEVVELILLHINKIQSLMMAMETMRSPRRLEQYQNLVGKLVKVGLLDKKVEFLPSNEEVKRLFAEGRSFERPQIAVLAAYSKMYIYEKIITSELPDSEILYHYLINYFPSLMRERFLSDILDHPLRREIIATKLANNIVNRFGCTFIQNAVQNTGFSSKEVIRVVVTVMEIYDLPALFEELDHLIGQIDIQFFYRINVLVIQFLDQSVYWLLRNYPQPINLTSAVEEFSDKVREISTKLVDVLDSNSLSEYRESLQSFEKFGLSPELSNKLAGLQFVSAALGIAQTSKNLCEAEGFEIDHMVVSRIYFELGAALSLASLREIVYKKFENSSYWQRISAYCLSDELCDEQLAFTREIAKYIRKDVNYFTAIKQWEGKHSAKLERYKTFYNDIMSSGELDINKFMMLVKRLRSMLSREY